jgi:hypothetical protein
MSLDFFTTNDHRVLSVAGGGLLDAVLGTQQFVTTPVLFSLRSIEFSGGNSRVGKNVTGSPTVGVCAHWIRFPSASHSADTEFLTFNMQSGYAAFLRWTTAGAFDLGTYNTSVAASVGTFTTTPANDTWYWFELYVDVTSNPWSLKAAVTPWTGSALGTREEITATPALAAQIIGTAYQGAYGGATGAEIRSYTGPWVVYTGASGDYPVSPMQGPTTALVPNANGTHNLDAATSAFFFKDDNTTETALTTSETTSYQNVDELPLASDVARVEIHTAAGTTPDTPAFRAAGTAVFSSNNVANPTNLTPVKNGATVNGDLMVLVTEARSITATVGTPTGWTLHPGFPKRSATASGGSIYVFTRIADGGANDAPTVTWTGLTTGTTGDSCGARILSYQKATTTSDGTTTVNDAASTTTITIPSLTTATDKSLVIAVTMRVNDTAHTFTVATYTERSDDHTTSGTGHGTETAELIKTPAGATGTATVTPSNTTSSRTLSVALALQAAMLPQQPTNTWYAEYAFADEGTITDAPVAVRVIVAARVDAAVTSRWQAKLFDSVHGTNAEDIYVDASLISTSLLYKAKLFTQRPNSGGAWTLTALNGLRVRFGYCDAAGGVPRLEGVIAEALFVIPVGATQKSGSDANSTTTESASVVAALSSSDANGTTTESASVGTPAASSDANGATTETAFVTVRLDVADAASISIELGRVEPIPGTFGYGTFGAGSFGGSTATQKSSSDSGTATESAGATAQISANDTNGATSEVVGVGLVSSDVNGSTAESANISVPVSSSDSNGATSETAVLRLSGIVDQNGATTETASPVAQVATADANGATAETSTVAVPVSSFDSNGPTTESASFGVQYVVTDAGSGNEASSLQVTATSVDTNGTTTEFASTATFKNSSDANGAIIESASVVAGVSSADAGTVAESAAVLLTTTDTNGTTIESVSVSVPVSASDSNSTTLETASVRVFITTPDAGTATETQSLAARPITSDLGTIGETAVVTSLVTSSDSGSIIETHQVAINYIVADSGQVTETHAMLVLVFDQDTGTAIETYTIVRGGLPLPSIPATGRIARSSEGYIPSGGSGRISAGTRGRIA